MRVENIHYTKTFQKEYKKLPTHIQTITKQKVQFFTTNPLHPSLRLHALKGTLGGIWSISITGSYRMLFERQKDGDIMFFTIGTHDIYKNL